MIPEINKRIRQLIDYKTDGVVKKFAELVGLPQQTLNRLFIIDKRTGKYPLATTEILQKISEMYDCISLDWLLNGDGDMLRNTSDHIADSGDRLTPKGDRLIPYVLQSAIAGFGNAEFAIQKADVKDYYVIPKFKFCRVDFMIEISGSSMYPKYNSGDVVACTILHERNFIQWNKCHIIATREQGILCKRLYPCDKTGYLTAISDNKSYPPFDIPESEITGIALIIGVVRLE